MIIKKYLTLIIFIALSYSALGQVGVKKLAQSTMNFQLVSISPKASAMGDAYYAVGTGAESMFYNPAGLADMDKKFNLVINYTQWIADIKYIGGALSWNLDNYGCVGINILTVDYGTIHGASLDPNIGSPLGYIDNGDLTNVGAYSFGISYAKKINTQFMMGINARYVGQNLGNNTFYDGTSTQNNASKLAFDMGVKYYTGFKSLRIAMALRNFATDVKREEISEVLPLTFTMGIAVDLMDFISPGHTKDNTLTIASDFAHYNNYTERINMGFDYTFMGMISVRGGYQTNSDIASWSAGVGFNASLADHDAEVNYSYSYITESAFKSVNRLSILFSF